MTTGLFLLRVAQLGIPISDLELLTIGMVTDMMIEAETTGASMRNCPHRKILTGSEEVEHGKQS